jgi:plasmid stability protein
LRLVRAFYDKNDRPRVEKIAARLEEALAASPEDSCSIRGEEVRSMIAEVRGDFAEAARSREAEIRKILELHALAANTPHWKYAARQYGFSDVSDRLDLLAILYDAQGETDRAVSVLLESKDYCRSHGIRFDAEDLLQELEEARSAASERVGSDAAGGARCAPARSAAVESRGSTKRQRKGGRH